MKKTVFILSILLIIACKKEPVTDIPHLKTKGNAKQLIVEGKPYLVLGGELGNSSASDMKYMQDIWPKMVDMHVNAALIREGYQPGQYPSAGPLPHLMDIWRAGAPSVDFLSPDIYFPNIEHWCDLYHRNGNPLFIPEAKREMPAGVKAFYAIGQHDGIGFSPFSIESTDDAKNDEIGKCGNYVKQHQTLSNNYQTGSTATTTK